MRITSLSCWLASSLALTAVASVAAAQPVIATSAVNNETKARQLYFDARERASAADHRAAVLLLDRAIALLGERKPRLMPVLIDSLVQLGDYVRAHKEAESYVAARANPNGASYKRIAAMLSALHTKAVLQQRQREAEQREKAQQHHSTDEADWQRARRSNTTYGYRYYLQRHPTGRHVTEATKGLAEAKRREDEQELARQKQQREQRERYERQRKERELRRKIAREIKDDAKSMKSSTSLYYSCGVLAIIGGGAAAVLLEDKTPRVIGGGVVAGGAVLLYLAQRKIGQANRLERLAEDIERGKVPLPPNVSVSPWLGPSGGYGLALGGRF